MREPQNKYACMVEIPGSANVLGWTDTRGRRAAVDVRRETRRHGIGAKGTVRVQQRGSKRWKILYQCVMKRDGRLSARGVELQRVFPALDRFLKDHELVRSTRGSVYLAWWSVSPVIRKLARQMDKARKTA